MKRKRFFCLMCGHARRWGTRKCWYCGAKQSDLAGIRRLARRTGTISLWCPYSRRGKPRGRCPGRLTFPLEALRQTIGVAGNGPGGYLLACRHHLQGRCPQCGRWLDSLPLLRHNLGQIRRRASAKARKETT